ncbi:GAF domain-containing protein [Geodermatophilus sp. SYSU D00691]
MTIAGRFEDALDSVSEPGFQGPELLPVRLARACARMLPVDGAGISLADRGGQRIPLGASSEEAAVAERLQFTVGEGPCTTAQESREPVFALHEDLRRRWPTFTDLLEERTPYCAVVALPLREAISGLGAIDLYLAREDGVAEIDVFEAMAVGDLVTSALSETAVWSTWEPSRGPDWLHGPSAERRSLVWEAMGAVALALEVTPEVALDLLRGAAYASGCTVDDVAADVVAEKLDPQELRPPED